MKSSTVAIIIIVLVAIGIIVWAVTSSQEGVLEGYIGNTFRYFAWKFIGGM